MSGHGYPPPYYGGYPPPLPLQPPQVAFIPAPVVMPAPMPPPEPSQPTYVTNYIYHNQPADPVQVVDRPTSTSLYPNLSGSTPSYPVQTPGPYHSTYITNYNYPPAMPVQVANNPPPPEPLQNPIEWIPSTPHTAQQLSLRAVVAGKEAWDNSPLWVIRGHHSGDLVPGKLAIKHKSAFIAHGGREIPIHNFEVLCAPSHMVRWVTASYGQVPAGAIPGGNTHTGEILYIGRAGFKRSITPGKVHPSHGRLYLSFGGEEVPIKHYEVLCRVG